MNRITILFIIILTLTVFSCTKQKKVDGTSKKEISVVTTINPYYLMACHIVGDKIPVTLFIPANASPHTFSPKPGDIKKLEDASLVVANGLGLEESLRKKLESLGDKLFTAADYLPEENLLSGEIHEDETGDHHHEGVDPHIWLNPLNLEPIAARFTRRMIAMSPENKNFFMRNLQALKDSLRQVDNEIKGERKHYSENGVITFHNSFKYFLDRYSIELVTVIEEAPGKIPSPRALAQIGKKIKEHPVKALFIEPQLNPRAAEIIAGEFSLKVDILDPLGFYLKAASPADLIRMNWNIISTYLR